MADSPETSPETSGGASPETAPEKPKKKIITVGEDRLKSEGERPGGKGRRGGKGRDRDDRDRKPAVPPALMRGPKPKAKAVEEEVPAAPEPEAGDEPEALADESAAPVDEAPAADVPSDEATA